jgi:hypothetical protein
MENHIPLTIVVITIIILWFLGRFLNKFQETVVHPMMNAAKPQGIEIAPDLHVTGIDTEAVREISNCLAEANEQKLTIALIRYRPNVLELDEYLSELRERYAISLGKPPTMATESERILAANEVDISDAPDSIEPNTLSKRELRALLEQDARERRLLNYELIEKFGGEHFLDYLRIYNELYQHESPTLHITGKHQHRGCMQALTRTGAVVQGRKIPLKERLDVLKFSKLRDIATELKIHTQFKRKSEATEALAKIPGSAVHLAMEYDMDDIFLLKVEPVDTEVVEQEWQVVSAYAALLSRSLADLKAHVA